MVEKHKARNQRQKAQPAGQSKSPESKRNRTGYARMYTNAPMIFFSIHVCWRTPVMKVP